MKKDNRCVREQITTRLIYNFLEDGSLDSYLDNDFYRCKTLAQTERRNKRLMREYKKERKELYKKASMSRSKRKSNIRRFYKNDK